MNGATFELLCLIGRGDWSEAHRTRAAVLVGRVAGETPAGATQFVAEAGAAGLIPLAYRHLLARASTSLPEALTSALTSEFQRHARRRFVMARRLRDLLGILDRAGIEAFAYKGPALAIQLFGNFAMRQFGDLDLLVRPADARRAIDCLTSAGLTPFYRDAPGWKPFADVHRRHEYSFVDPDTTELIELHWALADRFDDLDVNVDWLMRDGDTIDLVGRSVRTMSAERLVLALTVHGTRHIWARLSWLVDLAEVLRLNPSLDWDVAGREARRVHFEPALASSLFLSHELLDAPLPAWVRVDAARSRAAERVIRRLARGRAGTVGLADRAAWEWHTAVTVTRRTALLWRVATTPSAKDVGPGDGRASRWRAIAPRGVRMVREWWSETRARRHRG